MSKKINVTAPVELDDKDMEGKGNSLIRAQDIVLELMYALDQKLLDDGKTSKCKLTSAALSQSRVCMTSCLRCSK